MVSVTPSSTKYDAVKKTTRRGSFPPALPLEPLRICAMCPLSADCCLLSRMSYLPRCALLRCPPSAPSIAFFGPTLLPRARWVPTAPLLRLVTEPFSPVPDLKFLPASRMVLGGETPVTKPLKR